MTLQRGTRLGSYEILSLLGAGGMGEVYRARDTRLNRDVAIKVLPDAFVHDADRVARFKREAQVLASLNHPHIAAIYGFEESSGGSALVLELVEGPTLADRIARRPIPVEEALPIARQIAEALEAAHEHGIIHRDLKPANIKLTAGGTVKVLDFGLARVLDGSDAGRNLSSADLSASPTITSPAMTMGGVILGTAAYMSPEQARGNNVDRRTDIWAFGCVLYEMLTGKAAFGGDGNPTDVIARVIEREPDFDKLPAETPLLLQRLLRRCLSKNPRQRVQHIGDVRIELGDLSYPPAAAPVTSFRPRASGWIVALAVTIGIALTLAATTGLLMLRPPIERPAHRRPG
jgi:serine/threonine protein kinase